MMKVIQFKIQKKKENLKDYILEGNENYKKWLQESGETK
jgi:hypothetical protein